MEDNNNTRTNSMDGSEPQACSTILAEEIDPSYEPTEEEVLEYAKWLGMDLEVDQQLLWIVKEGLKAPLPSDWRPCETKDTKEMYYFNFKTGESTWDHPCDTYYRELYDAEKRRLSDGNNLISSEAKKRKEAERKDIQELLKPPPPAPIEASMPRTFLAGAAADLKMSDIQLANNSPFGSPLNTRTPLPGIGSISSSTTFNRSKALESPDRQELRQVESRPASSRFPDNRMKPLALVSNDAIGDSEERGLMSPLSRPNARHENRELDYQARHTSRKEVRNSRSSETTKSQDNEAHGSDESDYEEYLRRSSSLTYDYKEDSAASEKYTQNQSGRRQQLHNSRGDEQKHELDAIERSYAQAVAEARKQGEKTLEKVKREYRDKVEVVEDQIAKQEEALGNEQQRLEKARRLADDEFAKAERLQETLEERQHKLTEELEVRENAFQEATSKLDLRLQQAQKENSQIEAEIEKNRAQKMHELETLEICRKDTQRARDEAREVEHHKNDLKAKIETYQASLDRLKNQVAAHMRKHNELDQDIVEKREKRSRLEIELADIGKLREKAQDELDKIHDEIGDEQHNRELQGVESHEIQEQLRKIREEERSRATSRAEEQIDAANAKIEELQEANSLLAVDLAATETRLRDESSNFHAQIADLEKQLEDLSVRANTEGVLSPSSQKLAKIEEERDALSEELNRKSQLIEHLEAQLEGEQLRHSTELQQATDVISKNLNESELHKVIEKEQIKSEQLLRDLHAEREARENFDVEKRKLLEQIRCVEEERDERKKAQEELEYRYSQLQQQANKDISSELEVSRVDLDRLEQLNKRLALEQKQIEEQRDHYEHERNHLAQELASIQEQASERSSALSQEVANSKKALQDVQQELDICRKQLKGAEQRNEQLISKTYRVSLDAETQAELQPQTQLLDASQNAQLEQQQTLNTRLAKEVEHLQNELSSTAREANRLRTDLATVSQKLAQHETDQEKVSNLQQQIEEAKQETARAVESCKIAEAARAETIKAGATANENALEEIELVRSEVHSLQTQLLNAQIELDKGQLAKQQLEFQLEKSVSECRLLQQKVDQLSKELHAVSTDKAALESRLCKMELGLELETQSVCGVPNSRSEDPQRHVEHIEKLEAELKQFQDRNSKVNDLLKKTISDRDSLREEVARQKALIADLKGKLLTEKTASDPLLNSQQSAQAQLANIPQDLDSEVSLAQQFVQTATEEEEILSEAKTNVLERIQLEEKYMTIMLRKTLSRGLKKLIYPSRSSSLLSQLSLIEDLIQLRHEVLANANLLLEYPTSNDAKLAFETSHNRLREKQRSATRIEQHKHKYRSTGSEVLESDALSDSESEDSNTENDSTGGNLPSSYHGQRSSRRSESTPMVWPHQSCAPPIVPPGVYPFQHCVSYPQNHGIVYVDGQGNFILPTTSAPHGAESRHKRSFSATAMENQHVAKGYAGTTNNAWMGNPGVFTDTLHNSVVSLDPNQNSVVNDPALQFDQIESKWVQRREIAAQHSAWLLNFRKDMHRNPSLLSHDRPERSVLRPKKRSSRKRRALTGLVDK